MLILAAVLAVSLADVRDTATLTATAFGTTSALGLIGWAVKRIAREAQSIKAAIGELRGDVNELRGDLAETNERVSAVEHQLHPNGGWSTRDRLEEIAAALGLPPAQPKPDNGLRRRATDRDEQ